jgi:hypothetical protein
LANTDLELEVLSTVTTGIELAAIWESSGVVHAHGLSLSWEVDSVAWLDCLNLHLIIMTNDYLKMAEPSSSLSEYFYKLWLSN